MKKRILCALIGLLILTASAAMAETMDELCEAYALAGRRMWTAAEWETVILPPGLWKSGEDIPAGRWKLTAATETSAEIAYGPETSDGGAMIPLPRAYVSETLVSVNSPAYDEDDTAEMELDAKKGAYLQIKYAAARLSPLEKKSAYRYPEEKNSLYEGMSYAELAEERQNLREKAEKAEGWRSILLEPGKYDVDDGSAIRWRIEAVGDEKAAVSVTANGKEICWDSLRSPTSERFDPINDKEAVNITLPAGAVVEVSRGKVRLTTYLGQTDVIFE